MRGNGQDSGGVRDFLSLGSTSRTGERGGFSGRQTAGDELLEPYLTMLSKNGLNMLAGGSNGGFSLRPPAVGNLAGSPGMPSFSNRMPSGASAERTNKVTGGGFTGFYGASTLQPRPSLPGMGFRFASEETQVKDEAGTSSSHRGSSSIGGKVEQPPTTDFQNLSSDECWRLILKLGMRWPAWIRTPASQATQQGVMKEKSSTFEFVDRGHRPHNDVGGMPEALQLGQDSLRLLASRALEALAQTPHRYGRAAGGMLAPKRTTQEILETEEALTPTSRSTQPTLAVSQQPTLLAKAPTSSSREMLAPKTTSTGPRTAPLTIFYAGTVNVCDNVPEDKARLIMLFAEKAGTPNAQAPAVTPAAHVAPLSGVSPLSSSPEIARPHEDPKPFPQAGLLAGTSSGPTSLALATSANNVEVSTCDEGPVESPHPAKMATAELPPLPLNITVTTEGSPRPPQKQQLAKPLPNARKTSLARFLDSRKRNRGASSCSDSLPGKRSALGHPSDSCPGGSKNADDLDLKGIGSSQSSKEEAVATCANAAGRTTEPEMKGDLPMDLPMETSPNTRPRARGRIRPVP